MGRLIMSTLMNQKIKMHQYEKIIMRIISFIVFIVCFNPLFSQDFLDTLAQKNWITTVPFIYNGELVDPFIISDSLIDLYSENQLDSLIKSHVSPTLKFYSFIALYHHNYAGLF